MTSQPRAFAVRRAAPTDLESIARIQAESPEASQWEPASYLQHRCLVAVAGGAVAAFVVVRDLTVDEHEILNLAVAPVDRRHGAAKALIEQVFREIEGAVFLEVRESNSPARRFYESIGFSTVRIRKSYYTEPNEAAIEMEFQSC